MKLDPNGPMIVKAADTLPCHDGNSLPELQARAAAVASEAALQLAIHHPDAKGLMTRGVVVVRVEVEHVQHPTPEAA